MPESLENQFISDLYTSLLHLSGAELGANGPLNRVFDGAGNSTGLALSGKRVVINNYIYPKGFDPGQNPPSEWLDAFFPVGCLQLTFDDNDPNTRIAGTVWDQVAQGRFLVGVGTFSDKNGDTFTFCPGDEDDGATESGNNAGYYRHELTVSEMPRHSHSTNVDGRAVQVPSPVGVRDLSEFEEAGVTEISPAFVEQQQDRNSLANQIKWNFGNDFGYTGSVAPNFTSPAPAVGRGEYLAPVKEGMDLNFVGGSTALWSDSKRAKWTNNTNWEFKEMIGLWNGESRFIASKPAGRENIPAQSSQNSLRNINWYRQCLFLGAVDLGTAKEIDRQEQQSQTPLALGDINILNNQWNAVNDKESSQAGLGDPHNNIPPSYGVYVWKRIA